MSWSALRRRMNLGACKAEGGTGSADGKGSKGSVDEDSSSEAKGVGFLVGRMDC
jgi:hypothetical protein